MTHLMDRLAAAGDLPAPDLPDDTLQTVLQRGHAALARRRHRVAGAGLAVLAVAGVGVAGVAGAFSSGRSPTTESAQHRAQPAASSHTSADVPILSHLKLVAYTGKQVSGFHIATVPRGYAITSSTPTKVVLTPTGEPAGTSNPNAITVYQANTNGAGPENNAQFADHPVRVLVHGSGNASSCYQNGHLICFGYYFANPPSDSGQPAVNYLEWNNGITNLVTTANTSIFTKAEDVQFCEGVTTVGSPGYLYP